MWLPVPCFLNSHRKGAQTQRNAGTNLVGPVPIRVIFGICGRAYWVICIVSSIDNVGSPASPWAGLAVIRKCAAPSISTS